MLIRLFRHVRGQSKAVRNNYALGIASTFTGIVALVWLMNSSHQSMVPSTDVALNKENAPFSNIFKQAKEQFAAIKASSTSTEEQIKETEAVSTSTNIILSPEDIELAKKSQSLYYEGYSTTTDSSTISSDTTKVTSNPSVTKYQEVQIATTSSNVKTTSTNSTTTQRGFLE
jgi:hypothetical protein